jgi:hypothetical protein
VNGHLGGVRTWNHVGGAEQIEEFLGGEPAPPLHELVVHVGDVNGRTAKGAETQSQEDECQLPQ